MGKVVFKKDRTYYITYSFVDMHFISGAILRIKGFEFKCNKDYTIKKVIEAMKGKNEWMEIDVINFIDITDCEDDK